jgi:hypothetical protein
MSRIGDKIESDFGKKSATPGTSKDATAGRERHSAVSL